MKLPPVKRFLPGLIWPGLSVLAIVLFSALVLGLSYQARPTYKVDMGDSFDRHYLLDGFYAIESNPDLTYRWMSGFAKLEIKGVGKQPFKLKIEMLQSGLDPNPGKNVKVEVRGALLALFKVSARPNTYEVAIPPELISRFSGDLAIILSADIFRPQGERRDLGVVVTAITLEPVNPAGLIIPPIQQLLYVVAIGLVIYLLSLLLRLGNFWRLGLSLGFVAVVGLCFTLLRQEFTFYSGLLLVALVMALLATLVAQPVVRWFYRRGGIHDFRLDRGDGRWLFILFAVGLVIVWAGLLYPESDPNDFGFHLNRFRMVQNGDLYFDYIISGVGHSFYPPAMYVLLWPLSFIYTDTFYLIKLLPAIFNFLPLFFIYFLVKRYFGVYKQAAILASALYMVIPINLLVIWWAHQTNLFGLACMVVSLVYVLELYDRLSHWPIWLGLTSLFFVVLLAHPAILVFSAAFFPVLGLVFLGLWWFYKVGSLKPVVAMAGAFIVAGFLAFFLYYLHYLPTLGRSDTDASTNELASSLSSLNNLGGILNLARLTFNIGFLGDYGLLPLLLVPVGLVVLFKKQKSIAEFAAKEEPAFAYLTRFRWAVLTWLVVGLGGLLITFVTNLSLRPMLFIWPVVSILGGLTLAAFGEKEIGRILGWRKALVGILLVGLAALTLYFWFTANYLGQQPPHVF